MPLIKEFDEQNEAGKNYKSKMKMNENYVTVRVKGELAMFTRPENKVERLSYPIITPSASRGVLEAIYWHPQFRWAIREIRVIEKGETYGIFRNEVSSKMNPSRKDPYFASEDRCQRYSLCLRDVDYVIIAEPVPMLGVTEHPKKFREIFDRRVQRGQCFHRPYLGCREFAADFETATEAITPCQWTDDLGLMLLDMDYSTNKPYKPIFFEAKINRGIFTIPHLEAVK